jgi:hypothetical protein
MNYKRRFTHSNSVENLAKITDILPEGHVCFSVDYVRTQRLRNFLVIDNNERKLAST